MSEDRCDGACCNPQSQREQAEAKANPGTWPTPRFWDEVVCQSVVFCSGMLTGLLFAFAG